MRTATGVRDVDLREDFVLRPARRANFGIGDADAREQAYHPRGGARERAHPRGVHPQASTASRLRRSSLESAVKMRSGLGLGD